MEGIALQAVCGFLNLSGASRGHSDMYFSGVHVWEKHVCGWGSFQQRKIFVLSPERRRFCVFLNDKSRVKRGGGHARVAALWICIITTACVCIHKQYEISFRLVERGPRFKHSYLFDFGKTQTIMQLFITMLCACFVHSALR